MTVHGLICPNEIFIVWGQKLQTWFLKLGLIFGIARIVNLWAKGVSLNPALSATSDKQVGRVV